MPDKPTGDVANPAAGDQDKTVPLSALEGVRTELKQAKEEGKTLQSQVELYKANAALTPDQQVQKPTDPLEGLDEGDVVTVADVKRIMGDQETRFLAVANQLKAGQGTKDYEQIIEKYLPSVITANPELAGAIKTSDNPVALALQLAKYSDAYRKDQVVIDLKQNVDKDGNPMVDKDGKPIDKDGKLISEGDQILANQEKPGSASAGAGAGGGISAVDKVLAMTDEELEAKIDEIGSRA